MMEIILGGFVIILGVIGMVYFGIVYIEKMRGEAPIDIQDKVDYIVDFFNPNRHPTRNAPIQRRVESGISFVNAITDLQQAVVGMLKQQTEVVKAKMERDSAQARFLCDEMNKLEETELRYDTLIAQRKYVDAAKKKNLRVDDLLDLNKQAEGNQQKIDYLQNLQKATGVMLDEEGQFELALAKEKQKIEFEDKRKNQELELENKKKLQALELENKEKLQELELKKQEKEADTKIRKAYEYEMKDEQKIALLRDQITELLDKIDKEEKTSHSQKTKDEIIAGYQEDINTKKQQIKDIKDGLLQTKTRQNIGRNNQTTKP